jgi:hypothetical protein
MELSGSFKNTLGPLYTWVPYPWIQPARGKIVKKNILEKRIFQKVPKGKTVVCSALRSTLDPQE